MVRTQIQLPDELYERAKRFSGAREMSLAEAVRRALEAYLERFPDCQVKPGEWKVPVADVGEILVPLDRVREYSRYEEADRSFPHADGRPSALD